MRLACCRDREDVLDRVGQRIRMPRHRWHCPVHVCALDAHSAGVRMSGHVCDPVVEDPQAQPPGLCHAREHYSCARSGDQLAIGVLRGDPAPANAHERTTLHRDRDRVTAPSLLHESAGSENAATKAILDLHRDSIHCAGAHFRDRNRICARGWNR